MLPGLFVLMMEQGAGGFVQKPYRTAELVQVGRFLRRRKKRSWERKKVRG